jgi:hypothetical protein
MCRKLIYTFKENNVNPPITLAEKKDDKLLQLRFDKQECVIVFQRLRRFYGDEFFYEVANSS